MDFSYSPEDERFRQELRAWLTDNKPARAERVPHDDASLAAEVAFLRDWQRSLHAAGYLGLLWPREYGGRGARPPPPGGLDRSGEGGGGGEGRARWAAGHLKKKKKMK